MLSLFVGEYVLALAIASGLLAWTSRIRTRCSTVLWIDDYFKYILFFFLAAMGRQIIPHLGFTMFPMSGIVGEGYYFIFQLFLGLPLVLVFLYYFLRFSEGIAGRRMSPIAERRYVVISVVIFIASTFFGVWALQSGNPKILLDPQTAISGLTVLALALLPIRTVLRARSSREKSDVRRIALFAAAQIGGLTAGQAILAFVLVHDYQFGHHLISLLVNIPPWVVLARIAKKDMALMKGAAESRADLKGAFARLGVTPREGEIIQLVLKGKTNAEIATALFISPKTVKHHLYNIYLKLNVKNRVQLVNLFLTCIGMERPSNREPGNPSS